MEFRSDGRKVNETRKVTIKAGVLKNANGSAYIEFGGNKILAGVFGPRDVHPKHMSNPDTGNSKSQISHGAFFCR